MKYDPRSTTRLLSAMILASVAGAAAPAMGQATDKQPHDLSAITPTVDFRSSKWLIDRKVVNNNGESIATVSDLILDRGQGRIEHVVIKTTGSGGESGKHVVIPFGTFRWDAAKDRSMLAYTPEQLRAFPEYSEKSWSALKETSTDGPNPLREKLAAASASDADPYTGMLDTAKQSRIKGEVTKVERVRRNTFGEQVEITVKADDGSVQRVALGPSWYVNGSSAAPMRGDQVVIESLELPRDPGALRVGTHLKAGDRDLRLRDSDGTPAWMLNTVEAGGQRYSTPYSRYLLLSTLPGKKVDCRGDECGSVNDVMFDRSSGDLGFLSIDPNQNFMGIGDTKRLIPWSVATVTLDGTIRVDASKEMILSSIETPSVLTKLNTGTHAQRVYDAFGVEMPRFEPRPVAAAPSDSAEPWSGKGAIIGAIEPRSETVMVGTVVELTEVKFDSAVQAARAVKIRTAGKDARDEVVLLGPTSYMDNQKPMCKAGDAITLRALRTTINSQHHWLAKTVECKDTRVVLLDANNTPAWQTP